MSSIYVLSGSTTKFGELWSKTPSMLAREVVEDAILKAGLKKEDIEAIYVGNMLSGILGHQENLGSFFAEALGMYVPAIRLEAACASGGLAVNAAVNALKAGAYKHVLVLGIEKMTDQGQEDVIKALMAAGSEDERVAGATFTGLYALMAASYMSEYGVTEEDLAAISVKNHYHGTLNPRAQFQKEITVEDVMKSSRISDPLKLLDCSPISDGAAAVVLSTEKKAGAVEIIASEIGTDTLNLANRKSLTTLEAVKKASKKAYEKAGITASDVHVAEIHDCFSIAEAIATEDLGFSKPGEGARDIAAGKFTLGKGTLVTNSSGGLKACGHPVGATGVKQIVEMAEQLSGIAGDRQVKNATIGLTHNVGGSGAIAVVHILKGEN